MAFTFLSSYHNCLNNHTQDIKLQLDYIILKCLKFYLNINELTSILNIKHDLYHTSSFYDLNNNKIINQLIQATFCLEICYILGEFWQYKICLWFIKQAKYILNLNYELTGIMGKRTRFQQESKSQLRFQLNTCFIQQNKHIINNIFNNYTKGSSYKNPPIVQLVSDVIRRCTIRSS